MKNLYPLAVLVAACSYTASAQNSYPMETVGTPSNACLVTAYSGWANNGVLSFAGSAEVSNVNASNNLSASGGGNVFFTNVPGTTLEINGFAPTSAPQSIDLTFGMYGYNASNLSELILEYSTDGGTTYSPLQYKRLFRNYLPPTPWDVMESDPIPGNVNFANLKIRFRQTTSTQQFRIDDIAANFYYTLPIKLISFSGQQQKGENILQWKANSTDANEYFVVERSTDGRTFIPMTTVNVKGVGEFSYQAYDRTAGKTFYRLKLVDVSGKSNHSQIIYLENMNGSTALIQNVYPVPARGTINTQLLSSKSTSATVILTDMSGRVVTTSVYTLMEGMNNCSLNVQRLNSGMYIMKIITGAVTETRTVMIQ
ncbi:MAG TPA: T9SS type A sorting domain-containing protein [Chitinophagaceae bacterium]